MLHDISPLSFSLGAKSLENVTIGAPEFLAGSVSGLFCFRAETQTPCFGLGKPLDSAIVSACVRFHLLLLLLLSKIKPP